MVILLLQFPVNPAEALAKHYDVCVVGGGVGGLVTAAKIARDHKDKRVVVLEKNKECGGRMASQFIDVSPSSTSSRYRFDTGPSLLLLPDVYRETFAMLGENMADHVEILEVNPLYRCFFQEDSSSLDISKDEKEMRRSVESIDPQAWPNFLEYMKVARGFLEFGFPNVIQER